MIVLGVVLIVCGYLIPVPVLITIGWVLVAIGVVLLLISVVGQRDVAGRRFWF